MRGRGWVGVLALATGCLEYSPPPPGPEALEVVGFEGGRLAADEVRLSFSAALEGPAASVEVRHDGVPVPLVAHIDGAQVVLQPDPLWPAEVRLEVFVVGAVRAMSGVEWGPSPTPVGVFSVERETFGSPPPMPLGLVGPSAGAENLAWLLVTGPPETLAAEPQVTLTGHGPPRGAQWRSAGKDRALLRLEPPGDCRGGCGPRRYVARAGPEGVLLGVVRTSSHADHRAPVVQWVDPRPRGASVRVHVFADEAVVVQGRLRSQAGAVVALGPQARVESEVIVEPAAPLAPSTRYTLELEVEDVAGNPASTPVVSFETADVPEVRISELVHAPLRDWGDSEPEGRPFDPWPGRGAVTDNDEWVELVNQSDRAVDLLRADLELRVLDTSPAVTLVDRAPALYFGAGGSLRDWRPAEALVVRPRGAMSQRGLRLEVWGHGALLDAVELGADSAAVHRGGAPPDAVHEAVAQDTAGAWRWCVPTPGDPRPATACR